jgi:hypothetical protein
MEVGRSILRFHSHRGFSPVINAISRESQNRFNGFIASVTGLKAGKPLKRLLVPDTYWRHRAKATV